MAKLRPEERWRRHLLERFQAFLISGDLPRLRAEGLSILGRKKLLTPKEWWHTSSQRMDSGPYMEWHRKCSEVGSRFGIASWVVEMACLLEGYNPEEQIHVMEVQWPQMRVVTECDDPLFLHWLCYHAWTMGLYVVHRQGSVETPLIHIPFPEPPEKELSVSNRPPKHTAFRLDISIPPGFPPEAAAQFNSEAAHLGRELLTKLGYPSSQRMRTSKLVSMADSLRIGEGSLPSGGTYDIIDDIYAEIDRSRDVDLSQDQERRNLVKSRRHKVKKRLVDPHKPPS